MSIRSVPKFGRLILSVNLPALVRGFPPSSSEMLRYGELNGVLHAALLDLAKSPMLQWSLDRIQSIPFAAPASVVLSKSVEGSIIAQAQHRAILDAIGNREGARAENLAREHARFARQNLELAMAPWTIAFTDLASR